jgi:eukaryotic-like serine/threonine-protein kinase
MANPFGSGPFHPNPFGGPPPGPQHQPPPPGPPRDEANALATLSVVFAFVFAPAGLILGHLGLAQIRRSGERGRDRALVGVTLSYVFITAAVVALIVRAMLPDATQAAAPATTTTTAPTITTTTRTTSAPPPTVAPADVDGLLPNLEDAKNITGDPAMKADATVHQPGPDPQRGHIDRTDCWAVMETGAPEAYDVPAIVGFAGSAFSDNHDLHHQWVVAQTVSTYHDAAAAQTQLNKLLSNLRQCSGTTINATWPNGRTYPLAVEPLADAGNGITTVAHVLQSADRIYCVRAAAAKADVVIDVDTCSNDGPDPSQHAALAVTNLILGRIPG